MFIFGFYVINAFFWYIIYIYIQWVINLKVIYLNILTGLGKSCDLTQWTEQNTWSVWWPHKLHLHIVWPSTWNPSGIIWNPCEIIWNKYKIMWNPSEIMWSPCGIMWNPSGIMWNPCEIMWNPSGIMWNPCGIIWNPCGIMWNPWNWHNVESME